MKSCFVISPIGLPGSEIREHADDVFDFIIKPAAEKAGYAPFRADHEARPGTITEQMYDHILGDDLLIAILTGHNPNVFYEIAVAEAAARPLILLIDKGQSIPFDISTRRMLQYDLKPRHGSEVRLTLDTLGLRGRRWPAESGKLKHAKSFKLPSLRVSVGKQLNPRFVFHVHIPCFVNLIPSREAEGSPRRNPHRRSIPKHHGTRSFQRRFQSSISSKPQTTGCGGSFMATGAAFSGCFARRLARSHHLCAVLRVVPGVGAVFLRENDRI